MPGTPKPYRHVVLFRFRDGTVAETLREIEEAFRDLARALPFVTGFEWGRNTSPEGLDRGFTHCFIVTFAGPEGRDAYLPHPAHQAFCRRFLDPHLEEACVLDFAAEAGK
jgi:Stress responsive A/B Barrel Domain